VVRPSKGSTLGGDSFVRGAAWPERNLDVAERLRLSAFI
jgi:hypothetical protein